MEYLIKKLYVKIVVKGQIETQFIKEGKKMDYNFIESNTQFGIEWYDGDGDLIGTDWYATEEERLEAVDNWYAQTQDPNLEQ